MLLKLYVWGLTWFWALQEECAEWGDAMYQAYEEFVLFAYRVQYDPEYVKELFNV
jgi:hypothetical protein